MRLRHYLSSALTFLLPFAVLLMLWAVLVPAFNVHPRLFPTLGSVLAAGLESIHDGTLPAHIGASLLRVFVGTVLALAAAIPLGVLMGVSPVVSAFLTPLFRFFSVLAGIAWIPIASLWFGYGFGAITFVIFNAVFFIVTYNTLLGVSTIPREVRNAAASLGAGRTAMLTEVLLPGALPNIVTGIRTGLGFAWRGLIAAEMIATNVGLGYMLFVARDFYRTGEQFPRAVERTGPAAAARRDQVDLRRQQAHRAQAHRQRDEEAPGPVLRPAADPGGCRGRPGLRLQAVTETGSGFQGLTRKA